MPDILVVAIGVFGAFFVVAMIADAISRNRVRRLRQSGLYPLANEETEADVERLIRMNKKIDAIKVFRKLHGVGLKEAKEAVEARAAELPRVR